MPEEFKRGNDYTVLLNRLFAGQGLPEGEIAFREGFNQPAVSGLLNRAVMAHLRSFEPKHEHKIAGLAYLVSLVCDVRLAKQASGN